MSVKSYRVFLVLTFALAMVVIASSITSTQAANVKSAGVAATAAATTSAPAAMATMDAAAMSGLSQCMAPTPTPEPPSTAAPTEAATPEAVAATEAPTMAATAAPAAATAAATKEAATKAPTATKVPPTATSIPVGKKPATAGVTLGFAAGLVRAKGYKCPSVVKVVAGGPADLAGLKNKDIVLGFGADEIKDPADFYAHLANQVSGDKVVVVVQRGTELKALTIELGLNLGNGQS